MQYQGRGFPVIECGVFLFPFSFPNGEPRKAKGLVALMIGYLYSPHPHLRSSRRVVFSVTSL